MLNLKYRLSASFIVANKNCKQIYLLWGSILSMENPFSWAC